MAVDKACTYVLQAVRIQLGDERDLLTEPGGDTQVDTKALCVNADEFIKAINLGG